MLTVDSAGWLKTDEVGDPEIRIVPSVRSGIYRRPPCRSDSPAAPPWPVCHAFHTTDVVAAMEVLSRRIALDTPEKDGASWHFGISRGGVIWQSISLTARSRHIAGGGVIAGVDGVPHRVDNVGRCAAGTELESPGRLKRDGGDGALSSARFYVWPYYKTGADGRALKSLGWDPKCLLPKKDSYGQPFEVSPDGEGGWWVLFTQAQIAGVEALIRACSTWRPAGLAAGALPPLGTAAVWRYGHVDFPGTSGKEDPGALWPKVREAILARVFPNAAPSAVPSGRST